MVSRPNRRDKAAFSIFFFGVVWTLPRAYSFRVKGKTFC